MPNTYNAAIGALQDILLHRIRTSPVPYFYEELVAFGKARGFTPGTARTALHRLGQAGVIAFRADPEKAGILVLEVRA